MAEKKRSLDGEEESTEQVYDTSGTEPSKPLPKLRNLEKGEAVEESEETEAEEPGEAEEDKDEITWRDLAEAEASPLEATTIMTANRVGRGYVNKPRQLGFLRRQLGKRNRIFLIGGPVVGAIVIALVIFLSILPFKILHIVDNLQSHFFATSQNAVQKETNTLFSDYMRRYAMPAFRNCRVNIDKNCNSINTGSLVGQLYAGWKNAKIEDKLSSKYGVEISYNTKSNHYYLKVKHLVPDGLDLGTPNSGFEVSDLNLDDYINKSSDITFKQVSRSQLRAAINDALARETNWKGVMYRFKVGRMLEKKYGFKRCIFACDTRDNFADWKDNKLRAGKLVLIERVLEPRSQTVALVLSCVITDTCDPSHRTGTTGDGPEGEPQTDFEKKLQSKLDTLAVEETGKYADVLAHSNGILQDGYTKYLTKQVVTALTGKEATGEITGQLAKDALPVIGWINRAASTIGMIDGAGTKIKAFTYITNSTAMISTFAVYRTYADEMKTGHVDAALAGSLTDTFSAGDKTSVGGIASAEQAPIYGYLIDNDVNSSGQAIKTALGGTAYAASSSTVYGCTDGSSLPAGKLVCQNEVLGGADSQLVSGLDAVKKALGPLNDLAYYWNHSIGAISKKIISLGGTILDPAIKALSDWTHLDQLIGAVSGPLVKAFTDYLIPNPFSDASAGGHKLTEAAGGVDALNSDFAQNVLGGEKLGNKEVSAIYAEQNSQDWLAYQNQPLISRLFDTNSKYSAITKLAMLVPDSTKSASSSVVSSFLSNPLGKFLGIVAPIINVGHAQAAAGLFPDPFGVTQYGYPDGDPTLAAANQEPENYWKNNCSSDGTTLDWNIGDNQKWLDKSTVDSATGLPENDFTDPCLLILSTVGSAGGLYDSNLLTQDDLAGSSSTPGVVTPSPPLAGSDNAQQIAQRILSNKNIQLTGRDVLEDIQAAAAGQPGTAGVMTSAAILNLILLVGQSHSVQISAIQSGGTGHCGDTPKSGCPNDPHYTGDGVDFSALDGTALTGRDNGSLAIMKIAFPALPSGAGFGQSQCGQTPSLPNGDITFQDTCNHLHVQVPKGTP